MKPKRLMTNNVENRPLAQVMPLGLQVAVLAALSASGTLATNILLPSLPGIAIAVGVSSAQVTAAITIFLAMFALGQLVVGPMSDRFGRRVPVMMGFAVFFAGQHLVRVGERFADAANRSRRAGRRGMCHIRSFASYRTRSL